MLTLHPQDGSTPRHLHTVTLLLMSPDILSGRERKQLMAEHLGSVYVFYHFYPKNQSPVPSRAHLFMLPDYRDVASPTFLHHWHPNPSQIFALAKMIKKQIHF